MPTPTYSIAELIGASQGFLGVEPYIAAGAFYGVTGPLTVDAAQSRLAGWLATVVTVPPGPGPAPVPQYAELLSHKDQPNGYPGLDSSGVVASARLPLSVVLDSQTIDLCRPPYSCVPGTDITATVQAAVNALVVAGSTITFYFSTPGTYNINGAVQSGTVAGAPYAGQILIPAIPFTGAAATVKFRSNIVPQEYGGGMGVKLLTNAASGNVFSVIPANTAPYTNKSNVTVAFERVIVVLPANPQCGGLHLDNAWGYTLDEVMVTAAASSAASALTGAGVGISLGVGGTGNVSRLRTCAVLYVPTGIQVGDGVILEDVLVVNCAVALTGGTVLVAYLRKLYAMGCLSVIQPSGTLVLEGNIGWELTGATTGLLVNDPNAQLQGALRVAVAGFVPSTPKGLAGVFGSASGASPVNLTNLKGRADLIDGHPVDTFLRMAPPPSPPTGIPGITSHTYHNWRVVAGTFALSQGASNGILTNAGVGLSSAYVPVKRGVRGGESRSVSFTVVGGASIPNMFLYGHFNGNQRIRVELGSAFNNLALNINGTVVTQTAGSTISASTTYTVCLVLTVNAIGLLTRARVLLNGVEKLDHSLTAAETAACVPLATFPWLEDGFGFNGDTTSQITDFAVRGITDDDILNRNPTAAPTYGATVTPDCTLGTWQTVTVTNGTAFTVAAPTNPPDTTLSQKLTVEIFNNSGGAMGAITWNAAYVFAGLTWANPATAKKRFVEFEWNGAVWVAKAIATADY